MFFSDVSETVTDWFSSVPTPIAPPEVGVAVAPAIDTELSDSEAMPIVSRGDGSGATEAFGHFAEDIPVTGGQDVAAQATQKLDAFDKMTAEDKTKALDAMTPEEITQLTDDLPVEERERLVELAKLSPHPDAKLKLFMAGQSAKVEADAAAELDANMDPETAAKMKQRREEIAASTLVEMQREDEYLRAEGKKLTPEMVNEMIGRKTREHDLEMKHNVNLTADEHVRTDGALAGKRVVWTEDELAVMEAAFAQAPTMKNGDNLHLETVHRSEELPAGGELNNADHQPSSKMIRIADISLRDEATDVIDPTGKPGASTEQRETGGDPAIEAKYGKTASFMEWVVLHELGHNVHDFHAKEGFEKFQKDMMVNDLDKQQLEARVPPNLIDQLKSGEADEVEHDGYVYVRDGSGYKCFPRAVFDTPNPRTKKMPNPDPREYFAQHYNKSILSPEKLAKEWLDDPPKKEAAVKSQLEDAQTEKLRLLFDQRDTTEVDKQIAKLEEAREHATAQRNVWEKQFNTMRNDVHHTDAAEEAARSRLIEAGLDTGEFDMKVQRLSTPDQVARLEAEVRAQQAAQP